MKKRLLILASSYQIWHIPITNREITLQEALDSIAKVRAGAEDSLLMIRLSANPGLQQSGLAVYKTEIDLLRNDCIHILLGRGLHDMDAAFCAGFAMGSSKKVTCSEHGAYAFFAKHIATENYSLSQAEQAVFKEGIRLAYISGCSPLDLFNFDEWLDQPVETIRDAVGLESELLMAYYAVEQRRYPRALASQRLLPDEQKAAVF